jgi:phage I-like protein
MLRPSPLSPSPALCSAAAEQLQIGGFAFEVAMAAAGGDKAAPPDWIQLTPRGRVTARDGRPFNFDPEALAAAWRSEKLRLPVDFAHETDHVALLGAKPARAWIVEVEARSEGLFGRVEWMADAVAALAAKSYRYISPTFWTAADRQTARLMKGAALVVSPALGMPALASASHPPGDRPMKSLLAKLGLTENATEEEALAKLSAAMTVDPAAYAPIAQLNAANDALSQAQARLKAIDEAAALAKCQALVDKGVSEGRVAPAAKEHFLAMAKADFASAEKAIGAMPALLSAGQEGATKKAEADAGSGALTPEEIAMCAATGITAEQYKAAKAA